MFDNGVVEPAKLSFGLWLLPVGPKEASRIFALLLSKGVLKQAAHYRAPASMTVGKSPIDSFK